MGLSWTDALKEGDRLALEFNYVKDGRLLAERLYDQGRNSAWLYLKHKLVLHYFNFKTAHGICKTIALSSMNRMLTYVNGDGYWSSFYKQSSVLNTNVFVNQKGERFANEAIDSDGDISKLIEQQGKVFSITGQNLLDYYLEEGELSDPEDVSAIADFKEGDKIFYADTLEELAKLIGVPAETFVATIEQYDAGCAAGAGDSLFGKPAEKMVAVSDGPYYACLLKSLVVNTNAGIRLDEKCQVVDPEYTPVSGLYATGIAISGFVTDVCSTGNCQCVSVWSGSKAARCVVEDVLGGTVADDWYGDKEYTTDDVLTYDNEDEYQAWLAENAGAQESEAK